MTDVPWLNDTEIATWLKFRAILEIFPSLLDSQLRRDSSMTHMEYQVLAILSDQADHTLQMTTLAARTNSSLTRMSHVVTRLEAREVVSRVPCPSDGRATNVKLTDTGYARLVDAAPGHVRAVRAALIDALTPQQLTDLDTICEAILARIDPQGRVSAL